MAGVSKTTVSYVLNGRTDVAITEETRQRVFDAARELDYSPNRAARALATGHTQLVALWTPILFQPYYAGVIHHVQQQLKGSHYEMMVADTSAYVDWEAHLERLSQWPVDGIIALDSPSYVSKFLEITANHRTPLVTMGVHPVDRVDSVSLDIYPGAWDAVQHLLQTGCRRMAYLTHVDRHVSEPRHAAYMRAVREAGLPEEYITADLTRASAHRAIMDFIPTHGCPDAIFCHNDDMAIGANRALRDLGLHVPEDVIISGYDGTDDAVFTDPRLTTVSSPAEEMVATAWRLLRKRIAEPSRPPERVVLTPRLLVRESTIRGGQT